MSLPPAKMGVPTICPRTRFLSLVATAKVRELELASFHTGTDHDLSDLDRTG